MLFRSKVGVQVQDGRGTLVRAQSPKGVHQVEHGLGHTGDELRPTGVRAAASAIVKLACGDPEGCAPDPTLMVAHIVAATEGLREGLGCSQATVRVHIAQARRRLRALLEDDDD